MTERKAQPKDEQDAAAERAEAVADSQAEAEQRRADETIPGGKYRQQDGSFVNAAGEPIDEQGNVKKQDA